MRISDWSSDVCSSDLSGAGFPGLVIAIMRPDVTMTLVDSRAKKCAFLNAVAERCGVADRVTVVAEQADALTPARFDVISARALASLPPPLDRGLRFAKGELRRAAAWGMSWYIGEEHGV